jgi:hypothetical protein
MKYNFEETVNRSNTGSFKWDQMKSWNPNVGEGIAPFSVADMDLRNAPEITEDLAKFITSNVLGYTGPTESYFNAVCGWMKKRHNWEIKPEWITVYPGVVPAFFNAVKAYTKPSEGVIIMTPVYYPFYMAIETNGRKVVKNPLLKVNDRYAIDFEDLEKKAQDPNNKVLLFCSPHNPLGRVWKKEELQKVADICLKNNVLIISDEIHNDLIMPGYVVHDQTLERDEEDQGRNHRNDDDGEIKRDADMGGIGLEIVDGERQSRIRRQIEIRGRVILPDRNAVDDEQGSDHRLHHREHNLPEDAEIGGPIDEGTLGKRPRDTLEGAIKHQEAKAISAEPNDPDEGGFVRNPQGTPEPLIHAGDAADERNDLDKDRHRVNEGRSLKVILRHHVRSERRGNEAQRH